MVSGFGVWWRGVRERDDWYLTGFYGNPKVELREKAWKLLERVG